MATLGEVINVLACGDPLTLADAAETLGITELEVINALLHFQRLKRNRLERIPTLGSKWIWRTRAPLTPSTAGRVASSPMYVLECERRALRDELDREATISRIAGKWRKQPTRAQGDAAQGEAFLAKELRRSPSDRDAQLFWAIVDE